ncbi:MAG: EAL domain-containing protein [Aphanocapsa sp. GSE-SYN-MK-11-07L]|jgi:diguanylate cyclase (GGDEF)-like protein|nr:EAL domain-containing protein [Aphanocapsa sp. GSE-SYN-MK-11-07L]
MASKGLHSKKKDAGRRAGAITLRQKVLWIIGAITICLFVSLYTIGSTVLEAGFTTVEQRSVATDVKRVFTALNDSLDKLDSTAKDWSAWGATYDFIQNGNPAYIHENLSTETLILLEFNFALFFNRSGQLVYGKGVDLERQQAVPVTNLLATIRSNPKLLQHQNNDSEYRGTMEFPTGPVLLISRPILTNEQQGPMRGTLIVGRYLDASKIRRLTQKTEVPTISIYPRSSKQLPPDFKAISPKLTLQNPIAVQPLNQNLIAGYGLLPNIYGQPGLLIRVDIPRLVFQQAQVSLQTFLGLLLIAGILFTLVTLLLLEKLVLTRVFEITDGIKTIQLKQDLSQRLPIKGEDELSHLPIAINKMLAALELSQQELWQSRAQYQWQANHDTLTELPNRRQFEQHLQTLLRNIDDLGEKHVVCVLDLDRFKIVNDTCGHAAGDELLRQIGLLIQKQVRKTDLLARLGGDEFGILFGHCALEEAQAIAQSLQKSLQAYRFVWQSKVFTIGASIGLTQITQESAEITNVMTAADLACYAAKNQGGDRIHFYEIGSSDVQLQLSEMNWALKIRQAIEENCFCLYYQPIVAVDQFLNPDSRVLTSPPPVADLALGLEHSSLVPDHASPAEFSRQCEILLRLKDEAGNIVSPAAFIPIAERYNLMPAIDRWVVRTLLAQLQPLVAAGSILPLEDYQYAINLSGGSINDPDFADFLLEQFQHFQVPPSLICFEITETVAISNLKQAINFIQTLKQVGCKFALDDFGSGMSSFAYLQSLPVDFLKIDGAFIKSLNQNQINYEIVKSINSIAHLMNMMTIAEFVENLETLNTLNYLQVDYAQGYGIAKPAPFQDFSSGA